MKLRAPNKRDHTNCHSGNQYSYRLESQ